MSCGPITLISWVIVLNTRSVFALYMVRLIQGFTLAVVFTISPIYTAEITEPKIRGELCGNFQVFWYIGLVYTYGTGPYFDYQTYIYLACIPSLVFLISCSFIPESPYYLLMANKEDQARKALTWLRNNRNIDIEFTEMKESVEIDMQQRSSWKGLLSDRKFRKAFLIVQIVAAIKYLSGMSSIVLYATQTFVETGQFTLNSDQMTIMIGVTLIITTLLINMKADSFGRKPLLLVSTVGAIIFHSIIAVYYYLDSNTTINVKSHMWIAYVALLCFCIITNVGLGPVSMTIQAEYFPSNIRGFAGGLTGVFQSLIIFASIRQYQVVNDYAGVYMNYVIFALIALAGTIIFPFIIKETAGKSLGQIQKTFTKEKNRF